MQSLRRDCCHPDCSPEKIELIQYATEIKVRAERRAGEMLNAAAERGDMAKRGHPPAENKPTTLSDLGIYDTQARRWKQLAAMPKEHFETAAAMAKARVANQRQ